MQWSVGISTVCCIRVGEIFIVNLYKLHTLLMTVGRQAGRGRQEGGQAGRQEGRQADQNRVHLYFTKLIFPHIF